MPLELQVDRRFSCKLTSPSLFCRIWHFPQRHGRLGSGRRRRSRSACWLRRLGTVGVTICDYWPGSAQTGRVMHTPGALFHQRWEEMGSKWWPSLKHTFRFWFLRINTIRSRYPCVCSRIMSMTVIWLWCKSTEKWNILVWDWISNLHLCLRNSADSVYTITSRQAQTMKSFSMGFFWVRGYKPLAHFLQSQCLLQQKIYKYIYIFLGIHRIKAVDWKKLIEIPEVFDLFCTIQATRWERKYTLP